MRVVPSITGGAAISWATAIAIIVFFVAVGVVYTWRLNRKVHEQRRRAAGDIHEEPEPRPLLRKVA